MLIDLDPVADCDDPYDAVYSEHEWACPSCGCKNATYSTGEPHPGEVYNTEMQGFLTTGAIIRCCGCLKLFELGNQTARLAFEFEAKEIGKES